MKQIVEHEPAPLSTHVPQVPEGLERIVRTCLAKDPAQRYGSMREVAADLREVRRKMDEPPSEFPRRRDRRLSSLAGVAAVLLAAAITWWLNSRFPPPRARRPRLDRAADDDRHRHRRGHLTRRPTPGLGGVGWRHAGPSTATLIQGQTLELVPAAVVGYWGIAFTPDGSRLFYATKSAQNPAGRLFAVSVQGGPSTPVLDGIDSTTSFSRDGKRMAFYRAGFPEPGRLLLSSRMSMAIAFVRLRVVKAPEFFVAGVLCGPLLVAGWRANLRRRPQRKHWDAVLATIDAQSGASRSFRTAFVTPRSRRGCPTAQAFCSLPIRPTNFGSTRARSGFNRTRGGEPRRVTPDLLEYRNVSVRADGMAFVSVGLDAAYTLWRIPIRGGSPQRIASERYDGLLGVAPLPDGRAIVSSGERGNTQLALLDRKGSGRQILTKEGTNLWPAVTSDGTTVAFVSNRDGQTGIWRMNVDGSGARLLAHLPRPSWLSITPDGRFVICASVGEAGTAVRHGESRSTVARRR